jgi:cell division protein FtsQ
VAKTNPYTSRPAAALAFDEENADEFSSRSRAQARRDSLNSGRADTTGRANSDGRPDMFGSGADAEAFRDLPRPRRRAPVRQPSRSSFLLRHTFGRVLLGLILLTAIVAVVLGFRMVRGFLESDPRFTIASSSSIQILGNSELTRADLLGVFGSDLGRNIFFVPLARRQAELEQVPWVAQASVMRLLPDQIRVSIVERVPIAFIRLGNHVELADKDGVILHLAPATLAARHYSFPVVTGFTAADPPQARRDRMQLYQRLLAELDAPSDPGTSASAGPRVSSQISEIDLADLEDVRAVVPEQGSDILLHLGHSEFLPRFHSYQAHLAEWRQPYPHLSSVDLRYDRQVVLKMADGSENEASSVTLNGTNSLTAAPPAAPAASRPARSAAKPHHPAVAVRSAIHRATHAVAPRRSE